MKSDIWLLAKEMWEIVMLPAILGSYQGTRACCSLHQSATKFFIHLFYLLFECFISGWLRLIYIENSYNRNKFYITSLIYWGMSLNAACFSSGFFLWHSNINKYFQSSLFTDFCTNWFIPFKNSRVKMLMHCHLCCFFSLLTMNTRFILVWVLILVAPYFTFIPVAL